MEEKRKKFAKFLGAFASLAKAISASAETVTILSEDLNNFLRSDSGEIPSRLKQLSKITTSEEVSSSLSNISEALTVGLIKGISASESKSGKEKEISFPERLLDKLFSESGTGFASIVVGSLAKNTVMAFFSQESQIYPDSSPEWLELIQTDTCRHLIGHCIQLFVSTAVAVYLDKTIHVNAYEELFSGLTKPEHESKVKNLLVSVCSGAVETLVKTSHQVISNSSLTERDEEFETESAVSCASQSRRGSVDLGWVEKVSSALAIQSNRSLVLELTGRVTSETVRSSLEFFLNKFLSVANNGVKIVREEVIERGIETVRFAAARSVVLFAVFLAVLAHFFSRFGFDLNRNSNDLCIY